MQPIIDFPGDGGLALAAAVAVAAAALIVAMLAARRGRRNRRDLESVRESVDRIRDMLERVFNAPGAAGAFGEFLLQELVEDVLPPSGYAFQARLGNGRIVDCLITLPMPPGPVPVDAKFPLETYEAYRKDPGDKTARGKFERAVRGHVRDIAERYIIRGETAEWALMYVPSEAIFATLHSASFRDVVREAHGRRVGIVSPATLMAVLQTVRAVVQHAHMVERTDDVLEQLGAIAGETDRLESRARDLERQFNNSRETLQKVLTLVAAILRRTRAIGGE